MKFIIGGKESDFACGTFYLREDGYTSGTVSWFYDGEQLISVLIPDDDEDDTLSSMSMAVDYFNAAGFGDMMKAMYP